VKESAFLRSNFEGQRWQWLAFFWGLVEATCFFIVPDVLTSRMALTNPRPALRACFASLAGALLGGALLYPSGTNSTVLAQLLTGMDWLPGISPDLIEKARLGLETHGLAALFVGVLGGIPYKLYAVQAAGFVPGFASFLFVTAIARFTRFLLVTLLAHFVSTRLLPNLSAAAKLRIHTLTWAGFYLIYFLRMGL
jgi:membrane protein YqaA with SNARE-associated domain